ncbi:alpha/beta hydrolase [uncultured Limosilactobacillus sp.]|uniref:alpha/beta hydrolase n=1 Tax=uncultured Limosilactobacillus sp. TaxID=2837629 RepID=UPI0025F0C11C|nr:alpha/beta hydrolase [uncultured Limosilactobacillus sp.]
MKQHKKIWGFIIILLLIGIGLAGYHRYTRQVNAKHYINSSTPTIFVHGWGSSYRAETQMVNAAKKAGASNSIIRANVSKGGQVKLIGTIAKNAKNPIVEVNLVNNKSANYKKPNDPKYVEEYHQSGIYIKNVVLALQKRYHIHKVNFVGHSMGNLLIAYYLADNANNQRLPKLAHQVVIAGHFNGLMMEDPRSKQAKVNRKTGKPSIMLPEYKGILSLRQTYPRTARVMNIYGDIKDGSHSDSQVPVNSAKSYKYLVGKRAKSYVEHEITGKGAKHSNLHENKQVDQYLINFLWGKGQN